MTSAHITDDDVRSEQEYNERFNGHGTPDINALLLVFQASLNVLDKLLPLETDPASQQTIIKLKCLSAYQILRSLDILLSERSAQLRPNSRAAVQTIIDHPNSKLITDDSKRPFRNTLMHYGPDSRIDLATLSLGRPLYGLVEQCFSMEPVALDALMTTLITEVASEMNAWAGA
jgi:hypothetical protein